MKLSSTRTLTPLMGPSFVKDIGGSFKLTALSLCATQYNSIEKAINDTVSFKLLFLLSICGETGKREWIQVFLSEELYNTGKTIAYFENDGQFINDIKFL